MKKRYWILLLLCIFISGFVFAQVYSTFEIPIKVISNTPSEFRNSTASVCSIGGAEGNITCAGEASFNKYYGDGSSLTGVAGGNPFDQNLNTTDEVVFAGINISVAGITETEIEFINISDKSVAGISLEQDGAMSFYSDDDTFSFWGNVNIEKALWPLAYVSGEDTWFMGWLGISQNLTVNDTLKFTGGGYIYDNGTTTVIGHT